MRSLRWILLSFMVIFGAQLRAQTPDPVNLTAIWTDAASPGYGVNVVHQGSILFVAWYTYGADGKPLWLLTAATRQSDGRYTGNINTFDGQPFNLINNAQAWTATSIVGTSAVSIGSDGKLDFSYTVNGISQAKRLERLAFAANPPTCGFTTGSRVSATNYTDVWWKANESGWGLSMIHQGDSIFIAWYTYGSNNKPQWITGLATRQSNGSYTGSLNRAVSGTPFNQINGPATVFPLPTIGNFSLTFSDGENVSFNYTVDGITQTKAMTRYVYVPAGTPVTLCTTAPPNPGALAACDPGLNAGDFRTALADNSSGETTERVIGPGTYQGQNVTIVENYNAQNVLLNRYFMQATPTEILTLGNEAYQNGAVVLTTSFNPPAKFIRVPAVGTTYTHNYVGTNSGSGLNYTATYSETIRRDPDESRTVPAGTFNGCKFKRTLNITTFGIGSNIEMDLWQSPLVGNVRSSSRVGTPQGTTTTNIELVRAKVNNINYPN